MINSHCYAFSWAKINTQWISHIYNVDADFARKDKWKYIGSLNIVDCQMESGWCLVYCKTLIPPSPEGLSRLRVHMTHIRSNMYSNSIWPKISNMVNGQFDHEGKIWMTYKTKLVDASVQTRIPRICNLILRIFTWFSIFLICLRWHCPSYKNKTELIVDHESWNFIHERKRDFDQSTPTVILRAMSPPWYTV